MAQQDHSAGEWHGGRRRFPDSPWRSAAEGIAAVRTPGCPESVMLCAAVDRPTVQTALATNPAATPRALEVLVADVVVRRRALGWQSVRTMLAAARHPNTPVDVLARMVTAFGDPIGAEVGVNRSAPQWLRAAVVARWRDEGAARVAANPAIEPAEAEALARSRCPNVRWAATCNARLPSGELARLVGDPSSSVRHAALARLPAAGWPVVRQALLVNGERTRARLVPRLSRRDAERLAADPDRRLRCALARYTADADLLVRLSADPDALVRRRASQHLLSVL